ncbi:MAG: 7TM diverse intracellular signaling domain-containing protein, partial [Cytophagaceae bacterium]
MFKKLHLFSLLFLGSSLLSLANSPLVVDNTQDKFFILKEDKIDILVDYEKRLNFADVVKLPGHFRKIPDKWINKDRKYIFERGNNAAYWIRFTIENRSEAHKHWLIEFLDFNVEKVDLYIPNGDGTYQHHQAGSAYNFLFRPIRHKNFEFAIPYSPKAMVCYVRVEPGISNVFAAELKSYESFIAYSVTEYYLLGLFYGFVLLMGIYNLILYMNMRERQYLFYVFYVICVGLSSMCHDGTGFQYLWPDLPRWNENILTCSLFGMVLWTLFYSKWFLNIRFHAPLTNKIIDIMIVAVLGLLVFIQTFSWDYSVFLIPAAGIPFLLIYITGIRIFRQGFRPAWYFLMAFTFFFLGF